MLINKGFERWQGQADHHNALELRSSASFAQLMQPCRK